MYTLGVAVYVPVDGKELVVRVLPAENRSGERLDEDIKLAVEEARVADTAPETDDIDIMSDNNRPVLSRVIEFLLISSCNAYRTTLPWFTVEGGELENESVNLTQFLGRSTCKMESCPSRSMPEPKDGSQ